MRRRATPSFRERGSVAIAIVVAVALFAFAVVGGIGVNNARRLANEYNGSRDDYMKMVRDRLEHWYARNLSMEAGQPTYSSEALFDQIGVMRQYGVVLILSPQLSDGTVQYHKVAIVSPGARTSGGPSQGYGAYTADGTYSVPGGFVLMEFDGRPLQLKAVGDAKRSLERVANYFEQQVTLRARNDAGSDSTVNYFLPVNGCVQPAAGEMPCTNGEMDLNEFVTKAQLLDPANGFAMATPWGTPISLNNDAAENSSEAPFTMTVSAVTPWNTKMAVKAVQPIY